MKKDIDKSSVPEKGLSLAAGRLRDYRAFKAGQRVDPLNLRGFSKQDMEYVMSMAERETKEEFPKLVQNGELVESDYRDYLEANYHELLKYYSGRKRLDREGRSKEIKNPEPRISSKGIPRQTETEGKEDLANLIRQRLKEGKEPREWTVPYPPKTSK